MPTVDNRPAYRTRRTRKWLATDYLRLPIIWWGLACFLGLVPMGAWAGRINPCGGRRPDATLKNRCQQRLSGVAAFAARRTGETDLWGSEERGTLPALEGRCTGCP